MSSASEKGSSPGLGTLLAATLGLGLAAWMLWSCGVARVVGVLARAGWLGTLSIVAFHLPQVLASALGWRLLVASGGPRLPLRAFFQLRWIREAVNNLLPLAQIGGELVTCRLLQRRGVEFAPAVAGTIADLLMEIATQFLFTVLGLVLLVQLVGASEFSALAAKGLLFALLLLVAIFAALRFGITAAAARGLARLGQSLGWPAATRMESLHDALRACYAAPARVAPAAGWHFASWLSGGIEVCLILHFFGRDTAIGAGLVIESLGQASKSLGFAIPGALGVQEGGYLMVCSLFGLAPETGIALSLMKRVREVVWGVPGLVIWQRAQAKAAGADVVPITRGVQ
jgi:putative membrane protein